MNDPQFLLNFVEPLTLLLACTRQPVGLQQSPATTHTQRGLGEGDIGGGIGQHERALPNPD